MPWRRHNIRAIDIDNDVFSQENSEYIYVSVYMQNRDITTRSILLLRHLCQMHSPPREHCHSNWRSAREQTKWQGCGFKTPEVNYGLFVPPRVLKSHSFTSLKISTYKFKFQRYTPLSMFGDIAKLKHVLPVAPAWPVAASEFNMAAACCHRLNKSTTSTVTSPLWAFAGIFPLSLLLWRKTMVKTEDAPSTADGWKEVFGRNRSVPPPSQTVRLAADNHLTQSRGFQLCLSRISASHLPQVISQIQSFEST